MELTVLLFPCSGRDKTYLLPFCQRIIQFRLQPSKFIAQIICDLYGRGHCVANIPK